MHPDTRICSQLKSVHLDSFLAPGQIVPRHCAGAAIQLCNRRFIRGSETTCTAIAPAPNNLCAMIAKSAPYPPCTVTVFWPRWRGVPGLCPDASSGNTTSPYCRAVMQHSKMNPPFYQDRDLRNLTNICNLRT